ncbi:MAG: sulfurtransferase TusA family protein [Candidatus Zeuxoniibacter abyssi]|nr:MAG: sulfurtransferase TusA family protein [Candidatus Persebacteraceae bacterium AB1(2)]
MSDSDGFIDLSGLRCPLPVLRVKKALGEIKVGKSLRFFATDPGAVDDIPAFILQAGHRILKITPATGGNFFEIRKQ